MWEFLTEQAREASEIVCTEKLMKDSSLRVSSVGSPAKGGLRSRHWSDIRIIRSFHDLWNPLDEGLLEMPLADLWHVSSLVQRFILSEQGLVQAAVAR